MEEWSAAATFVFAPASAGMIWPRCRATRWAPAAPGVGGGALREAASQALTRAAGAFHYACRRQRQVYCSLVRVETCAPCGAPGEDVTVGGGRVVFRTTSDFLADDRDFRARMQQRLLAVPWSYGGERAFISLSGLYHYTRAGADVGV